MWILVCMWTNWISQGFVGLGTLLMAYVYMHLSFYVAHGTSLRYVALWALLMAHLYICIWAWVYAIDPLWMINYKWLGRKRIWEHQSLRSMKWQAQNYDTFEAHSFLPYMMMFPTAMFTHLFLEQITCHS